MLIVTFSGLDGCGKSTHVRLTADYLSLRGYKTRELVTWRISVAGLVAGMQERIGGFAGRRQPDTVVSAESPSAVEPGERGLGFDRDRRSWASRSKRLIAYPVDAVILRLWIRWLRIRGYAAVVCDRYCFDQMVNLPNPESRLARLMRWMSPRPHKTFFIDASPATVAQRRVEHSEEYYRIKYEGYRRLTQAQYGLESVLSTTIDDTQRCIQESLDAVL